MGFLSNAWKGLKGAATVGSFIPGVNAFAAPLRAGMAGAEGLNRLRKGNYRGALMGGLEAGMGFLPVPGSGAGAVASGWGAGMDGDLAGAAVKKGLGRRILGNVGNSNFGPLDQDPVRQGLLALRAMTGGGRRQGGSGGRQQAPFFLRPTITAFKDGGISGVPDIPRLPDGYEGYVDGPHLKSLGGNGPEVVVPLWKLMNQTRG